MKDTAYIGVDPGLKGQMCLLVPRTKQVAFIPTIEQPHKIHEWLGRVQEQLNLAVVMIEDVHSIFGASAKSNFNFGFNVGSITSAILTTGSTLELVQPKRWQKAIGVKTKGGVNIKKEVADICSRLYPLIEIRGPRGGLIDGRSDSLMIAHYASQTYKI